MYEADFIKEKIDAQEYLTNLPPITELNLVNNLDYHQTEFKPTLFRYIRLMDKENRDKDGHLITPNFSYDKKKFSPISYSYPSQYEKKEGSEEESIRRLQRTKLEQNSYPFGPLVPSDKKRDISDEKPDANTEKNDFNSISEGTDNRNVSNLSQKRHYDVQNFSIIILCLLINAFSCIIYYTCDWPDIVNRLPNQITLSKIIINDSFIFTGDRLYIQENDNLTDAHYQVLLKNINYGSISIDASNSNTRVRCQTTQSTGNSLIVGLINFTLKSNQNEIEITAPEENDVISVNMDIENVDQLDLRQTNSIFKQINAHSFSDSEFFQEEKRESMRKTLLKRSINSNQFNLHFLNNNKDEIYYRKIFEIKENVLYGLLFENNTLSLIHARNDQNQRPKINSIFENKEKTQYINIDWDVTLATNVEAADVVINDKMIYYDGKEIKFIYITIDDFHLHLGKLFFDNAKCSKILDFDLMKINLSHIYGNNREETSKIKLFTDSKGFPTLSFNENTIVKCSHPLCLFDRYP